MPTFAQLRTLLGAAACAWIAACGSDSSNSPDRYNGWLDGQYLDSRFAPATCGTGSSQKPCYPYQQGYVGGKVVTFWNFGAIQTSRLQTVGNGYLPAIAERQTNGSGGMHVDNFPNGCVSDTGFNPRTDAYPRDVQRPIFSTLPLPTGTTAALPNPVVALYGVTGAQAVCNDLKAADSIDAGKFGAKRTTSPVSFNLWAPLDFLTQINVPTGSSLKPPERFGWYNGLQLRFLDGGEIPVGQVTDPATGKQVTALLAMDAVLLGSNGSFGNVTDNKAILMPFLPGNPAYSPLLRLWDYKAGGAYTGLCGGATGVACGPANLLDIAKAQTSAAPFNTLFIVAVPQ